ncbi:MAG: anti-sigma factor [Paracoccaceae bacterium]
MSQTKDHNDDNVLAGEYALHLLDAEARRLFEARLAREPQLRALLRDWDENFASLADEIAPVTPPSRVKGKIDAVLFAAAPSATTRRRSFLNFGTGVIAGFALALLLFVVLPVTQFAPSGPTYTAEIAAEDRTIVILARYEADAGTLQIERIAGQAVPGRVLELWLIADGASGPVSLGVLPSSETATITISDEHIAALAGGTLAISDEPPGGSPTGQPTGAILAVGKVNTL